VKLKKMKQCKRKSNLQVYINKNEINHEIIFNSRNDLKVKSKVGQEMRLVKMKSSRYDDSYESDLNTILKSFSSGIMGNK
jgi:hypothetical protein